MEFVSTLNSMKRSHKEKNLEATKAYYKQLLLLYNQIQTSNLDEIHKEIAYDQTMEAYRHLEQTKEGIYSSTETGKPRMMLFSGINIIAAAVIIIAVSFVIFLNPSIIGLPFLDEKIVQTVDLTFTEGRMENIAFREPPTAFAITGTFAGEKAKLYLLEGEKRFLVFDSSSSKLRSDGSFSGICMEACSLDGITSNQLKMEAEVKNGILYITELVYTTKSIGNNPPFWNSKQDNLLVTQNTEIDLKDYFFDEDLDELTFLATKPVGVEVIISGSIVQLNPEPGFKGESEVTFIASDGKTNTKHSIIIIVE